MRIEIRQIVLEHRRGIALRIDGDEQRAGAIGVGSERLHHLRHVEQRGRADIGAMGEAEKHQERLALHVGVGDRLAVLIFEMERAADRRDRLPDRKAAPGDEQNGAEKQEKSAQERGEDQHDAGGFGADFRGHRSLPVSRSTPKTRRGSSRKRPWFRNVPTVRQCRASATATIAPAASERPETRTAGQ